MFFLRPLGGTKHPLGGTWTRFCRRLAQRDRVRVPRPARELLGVVIETIRHPPVGGQGVLAVLGGVAEGTEPFLLESRDRFAVCLEIDHIVARHERDHQTVHENTDAPEHAADIDRTEIPKQVADGFGVHLTR